MKLIELKDKIPCLNIVNLGETELDVHDVSELESNQPNTLTWCSYENRDKLRGIEDKIVIIDVRVSHDILFSDCEYIVSYNPRQSFMEALKLFDTNKPTKGIRCTAEVNADSIGDNPNIGHNVIIEEGCSIGNNVTIGHNTVILKGTIIHDNVMIGCNCTIGGVGFGYERNDKGNYEQIPHIGGVIIYDFVEIGNNTCIDRAVIGNTIICMGAKIDNLVHIAHGVMVGSGSLVIANSMIAGSVTIKPNSWIAPSSSIMNKKEIGHGAVVGMGAVVIKDVEPNTTVVGNPAKPLKK